MGQSSEELPSDLQIEAIEKCANEVADNFLDTLQNAAANPDVAPTSETIKDAALMRKKINTLFNKIKNLEKYSQDFIRKRDYDKRVQILKEQTVDQPAGTPVLIDGPRLHLILAPSYLKKEREHLKVDPINLELINAIKCIREELEFETKVDEKEVKEMQSIWGDLLELGEPLLDKPIVPKESWEVRRKWYSESLKSYISILENSQTKKCKSLIERRADITDTKVQFCLNTYEACNVYSLEAEEHAMQCLRSKVTSEQYLKYVMSGMIIEKSQKKWFDLCFS